MVQIRLNKYLAQQGLGSRRKCDEYIVDGLIRINGEIVTELGTKVDPGLDNVTWDIQKKAIEQQMRYIMLNKPAGVVTTCAEHKDEKTVIDLVDIPERIFPIGRLDKPTTGLLVLTNDGRITHKLLHPSSGKEKEYLVTVKGALTPGRIKKLESGVSLFGEKTKPTKIEQIGKQQFKITLTEGKNRQIRRICQKVGLKVVGLKRVRMNQLWLDEKLKPGQWRDLTKSELNLLTC